VDPTLSFPTLKVARKLIGKKLGFRTNMDLIPLDATLVKGSHGTQPKDSLDWPIILGHGIQPSDSTLASTEVLNCMLNLFER
jgi:hypothetical protein